MPKRGAAALAITVVALVLLLSFKTPDGVSPRAAGATGVQISTAGARVVDGPVVSTRYGNVQVEVAVANGAIKDVSALLLPTGRRSGSISDYAAPILRSEALASKNGAIDTVSGATYTSQAYAQSLQAALTQAHP
jgi:uncharacterized protein with FMN-binding domain